MDSKKYTTRSGKQQFKPVMSEEEFRDSDSMGFCLACASEAFNVEPDARKYVCESCGLPKVYGLEELLMMGLLTFTAAAA